MGVHVKKMAILEKKLDHPSGTLGCPIDELARLLGIWCVLGGGRSVAWALQAHCGVKKRLSAWPQNRECGKLKKYTQIRLEGVKKYPSSVSHFFTGRVRLLGGLGPSAAQWARFRSWALWWSAIADMRAGAGQAQPGPSPPVPPVPFPSPPAGCAGEPCRGQSWPGSHEHARATRGTRCRGLPEHPSAPGFKQSSIFY